MADMKKTLKMQHPGSLGASLVALLLLGGCATRPLILRNDPPPPVAVAQPQPPAAPRTAPDAVYTLESGTQNLPGQVNRSLEKIAQQVKANRDLVIRLESYTPSGGSREMNVSLSTSAVERIRRRLMELGVPSYRITQAPLGEEHPNARQLDGKRVELFIVPLPR